MTHIAISDLTVAMQGRRIVEACSLQATEGQVVGLIGPNGSGKSTLLRAAYRVLRPSGGSIHVDGADVWRLSAREAAKRTAVVAQHDHGDSDFLVAEVVAMGRGPHKRPFERDSGDDRRTVIGALERVGADALADRRFAQLSGGERQRVLIARALAQGARLLILDEPTNHLDIRSQLELLELVRALGLTVICAIHDLNLAAAYSDQLYVVRAGRIVAGGPPADVLSPELVADVFGVQAHIDRHPVTGRLRLHLLPLAHHEHRSSSTV